MLAWVKRLLFDEAAFRELIGGAEAKLRAIIALAGGALASGTITLDSLGANFGKAGWYAGWALLAGAVLISSGDKTPDVLKQLADHPEKIQALIKANGA